ncbi:MAG: HAD family hydrolase [Dehalococcoidia bacterium]
MGTRRIRAVTFDLWNTLIVDTHEGGRARSTRRIEATRAVLEEAGRSFSKARIEKAYRMSQERFEEIRGEGLDMPFPDQVDLYLDLVEEGLAEGLDPSVKRRIAAEHADAFFVDPPALMPGALEVLKTLKTRGCKLGLICNSGATPGSHQRRFLADIGLARYLEVLTFSDEERLAKPSPNIFKTTLEGLDVPAEAAVHIGDRPETDVLGAKGVGMRAVLIGRASCDGIPVAPDARIEQLAELLEVLERISRS